MLLANFAKILITTICIFGAAHCRDALQMETIKTTEAKQIEVPLYLPKKEAVRLVTFGYEHFTSTLLWFSTLNYFGEKFLAKEAMPWFNHQCDLVSDLDPKARHVFEFCGTLLSWIAREPLNSNKILSKGMNVDPNYWRYYYLRGFNYWYFLEDLNAAKEDFENGSLLPDAPAFLVSIASRLMVKEGEEDNAIAFLKASYVRTTDLNAKQAIAEKLNLAVVARDIRKIKQAIAVYQDRFKMPPLELNDLMANSLIKELPKDPFGESYLYDRDPVRVYSNKGLEGLSFKGKSASNSALKTENIGNSNELPQGK